MPVESVAPVVSYSQMFHMPVHAATPLIVDVLVVGHFIENTIFLPSYDTSGSEASPLPWVKRAVRLYSIALADDFSRSIRSPPAANGVPSVGLRPIVLTRFA